MKKTIIFKVFVLLIFISTVLFVISCTEAAEETSSSSNTTGGTPANTNLYIDDITIMNGATDIAVNGNFESVATWTYGTGCGYKSTPVHGGASAMSVIMDTNNTNNWLYEEIPTASYTVGDILTITFYAYYSGSEVGTFELKAVDSTWATYIGDSWFDVNKTVSGWNQYTATFTVPAGTGHLTINVKNTHL